MPDVDFQRLFEQSWALLLVLAPDPPDFTVLDVTDAYLQVIRRPREAVVGRALFDVFPANPDDPASDGARRLARSLAKVLASRATNRDGVHRYDIELPGEGFRAHWWSMLDVPIFAADGAIACILHRVDNVSELVRKHAELEAQRARAEAASAAKSAFLSSMSHELRTPLNAIVGFAQLLVRDRKLPLADRHAERVRHILEAAEHLVRLVDDVLDLSRIEVGHLTVTVEPIAVQPAIAEAVAVLAPLADAADVALIAEPLPADLPLARADRTRLAQILVTFGANAIQYSRPGDRVTIRTAATPAGVRITVVDDGLGIAPEHHAKVFAPFERAGQASGPSERTGIGLAIAERLAALMGGSVGSTSERARGSELWVELASAAPSSVASPPRSATTRSLPC